MRYNEFAARVLDMFPLAEISEDSDGQLIINTGMTLDNNENVITVASFGEITQE